MPKFSRRELEQALQIFNEKRDASSRAPGAANGIFADAFIDDSKRDAGEAQTAQLP